MGQQTILRVETGKVNYETVIEFGIGSTTYDLPIYETLDLYASVPIKINKSYAEIQDISKKNSDYSVPISLPGSKKNNKFFETFYNVDQDTLYFDPTKRVNCQVLIDDQVYFKGYLRLNKVAVKENKVEYNVTLYSTLGDLFGKMGNNLLSDLNYSSGGWNGALYELAITDQWAKNPYKDATPPVYFFPVVHNGYVYDDDGNVDTGTTRLYTSTKVGAWSSPAAAASAGVTDYNLNSPVNGLFINQLKPALSVYHLTEKIFAQYGYTLRSEFKETPWFKQLYMYGYFSSENVLFSEKQPDYEVRPVDDVDVIISGGSFTFTAYVVKSDTGVPCYSSDTITVKISTPVGTQTITIEPFNYSGSTTFGSPVIESIYTSNATISSLPAPYYTPTEAGTETVYGYGSTWNINKVMDPKIKQIDFIASLAKKFNLLFTPDLDEPNVIIMEPLQYYIGSGDVKDWSGKLSYDQGFTIEPAQNFVEAEIILTDKNDEDGGNAEFERIYGKVYGTKQVFSNTDFKSRVKKIETIFSPEIVRKWDVITGSTGNIGLPLGINYSESSSDGDNGAVTWTYEGLKTNPKLFYYVDNVSPFIDEVGELFVDPVGGVETLTIKISEPGTSNQNIASSNYLPLISHTSPVGNNDEYKITNDTQSILFGSERSLNVGVEAYNAYSKFDLYTRFYENNINNLFNKNTRFLKGKFHLDLADILNIKPKELIKIKEQYFMWNKISQYNLTNQELTEVELVQYNNTLQTYPVRYFKYFYCDNPTTIYRFKTDMTNDSLTDTAWARSVRHDYLVGALGSINTYVTFGVLDPSQGTSVTFDPYYVGCTEFEVDEDGYNSGGALDREYDALWQYTTDGSVINADHDLNSVCYNILGYRADSGTGTKYRWINAYTDCSDFNAKSLTYGFTTGSSTTHTAIPTPTPTPTRYPVTPTPTPYYNTDGSLIVTYEPIIHSYYYLLSNANPLVRYEVYRDGELAQRHHTDVDQFYSTLIREGEDILIRVYKTVPATTLTPSLIRRDFTNDNEAGDLGIKETSITPTHTIGTDYDDFEFTITLPTENCSYEYRFEIDEVAVTGTTCMTYEISAQDITRDTLPAGPEFAYIDYYTGEARYGDVIVSVGARCFLNGWSSNDFRNSWWRDLIIGPVETQYDGWTNFGEIQCPLTGQTIQIQAVSGSVISFKEEVVITEVGPCPTPLYGFTNEVNYLYMFNDDSMLWWANPWDFNMNKQSPYYLTDPSCNSVSGRTAVQDSYGRTVFLMGKLDENGCVFSEFDPQSGYGSRMSEVGSPTQLIEPRPSVIIPQSDGSYYTNRLLDRGDQSIFEIIAKYDVNGVQLEQQADDFASKALFGTLIGQYSGGSQDGKFLLQDGTRIARIDEDLQDGYGYFTTLPLGVNRDDNPATPYSHPRTHGFYNDINDDVYFYGEYGLYKVNPRGYQGDYDGYFFQWANPVVYGEVYEMKKLSGGELLIAGDFQQVDNYVRSRIAVLDITSGLVYPDFFNGYGFNGIVRAVEVQSDGKILIGGDFTEFNGIAINHFLRLNSDYTLDETFTLSVGSAFNDRVNDIKVDSVGNIIVVGAFSKFNGLDANGIAKLNSSGVLQWPLQTFPTPTPGPTQTPLPTPGPTSTPIPTQSIDVSVTYNVPAIPIDRDIHLEWKWLGVYLEPTYVYPDIGGTLEPFGSSDVKGQMFDPNVELIGNQLYDESMTYTYPTLTGENFTGLYKLKMLYNVGWDDFGGSWYNMAATSTSVDVYVDGSPVLTGLTISSFSNLSPSYSLNGSQYYLRDKDAAVWSKSVPSLVDIRSNETFSLYDGAQVEIVINTDLSYNFAVPQTSPFPTATPTPTPTPTAVPSNDVEI